MLRRGAHQGGRAERNAMMDRTHPLPIRRQGQLLQLARSTAYYHPRPVPDITLVLMRRMGITAIYRKPRTSQRHPAHRIYPYRLRQLTITRPNHVWAADITYIPMRCGFVYLCAILDWASRRVLAWRLSNTLTTDFCLEAVQEAIARYGPPEIFNTDQGCQFTSLEFTGLLKDQGIQISMDGRGCWRDNVFVERLWRSLKYEEDLDAYEMIHDAQAGIARYLTFYNESRPHRALDGHTPDRVCWDNRPSTVHGCIGSHRQAPLLTGQILSKQAEPPLTLRVANDL